MRILKVGLLGLFILCTSLVFAEEPDNKLPESDSITINWDLTKDSYTGYYSLKFTSGGDSSSDLTDLPLTTTVSEGKLTGSGICYLEWVFFATESVEVSVYSSNLQGEIDTDSSSGTKQSLDWHADITNESGNSSNAEFVSSPAIGFVNQTGNYGSETEPVKVFEYDPSTNGLKDSGKAKFTITTEDASLLKPDSFTTTLTAVVKPLESSSQSV